MSYKLAIVIPAFKNLFFENTLKSIADQTNKNFVLYIGNDASPDNIENTVKKYCDQLNIVYKEFENNLGSISLVKHWNRCVELVKDEEYVWFFSDDDTMDAGCVDAFYNQLVPEDKIFDLYRFNTRSIDESGNIRFINPEHPEIETSDEFVAIRMKDERMSSACEYIFNLEKYKENGGFIEFPLGWCSDDATWLKLSSVTGIKGIFGPRVNWRISEASISGSKANKKNKISALKAFLIWLNKQDYLINNIATTKDQKFWIFRHYFKYLKGINLIDWYQLLCFMSKLHKDQIITNIGYLGKFVWNNLKRNYLY